MIRNEAPLLLAKLQDKHSILHHLNGDLESRPYSTRLHGHFDFELKKSQQIIERLCRLLRRYHSFEFSPRLSLQIQSKDDIEPNPELQNGSGFKPIDQHFLLFFKDICLSIEREWKIGTKLIIDSNMKSNHRDSDHSDHSHSDSDGHYHSHRNKQRERVSFSRNNRIGSNHSSPIHSFRNPTSPLHQSLSDTTKQTVVLEKNVIGSNTQIPVLNLNSRTDRIQKVVTKSDESYHAS